MARRIVQVQTIVYRLTGELWSNAKFIFQTTHNSFTADAQVPSNPITAYSDALGLLRVNLWDNSEGAIATQYKVTHPDGKSYKFSLNSATPSPVELSTLELLGVGSTAPNYDTLLSQFLNNAYPTGGQIGDQLAVLGTNPLQVGWVPSGSAVKQTTFTQAELSVFGVFPFVHNLNTLIPILIVVNGAGQEINPDAVLVQGPNAIGVVLDTYAPLIGTYTLKVYK